MVNFDCTISLGMKLKRQYLDLSIMPSGSLYAMQMRQHCFIVSVPLRG